MTERVLVAGATGCLGRHVCAAFRDQGASVVAVARRHVLDNPGDWFVPLDLTTCAGADLAGVLTANRVTTVVNAVLGWGGDDVEMVTANMRPVATILAALRHLPAQPRLIQLGTVHEYGPMKPGTASDEMAQERPASSYARAKVVASRRVMDAARSGSADAVVLRLANTVGPRPAPGSFLGSLAARLRGADPEAGLEVPVAEAYRDYVDVRDAAAAVVAAARSTAADPLVNVGSGHAYRIRALVDELVAISGLPSSAVRIQADRTEQPEGSQSGAPSAEWVQLDSQRARRLLGWRPRYDIARSLRDMYGSVPTVP